MNLSLGSNRSSITFTQDSFQLLISEIAFEGRLRHLSLPWWDRACCSLCLTESLIYSSLHLPGLSHLPALSTKVLHYFTPQITTSPFSYAFGEQQTLTFPTGALEHPGPAWQLWGDIKCPVCLWRRKTSTFQPVWEAQKGEYIQSCWHLQTPDRNMGPAQCKSIQLLASAYISLYYVAFHRVLALYSCCTLLGLILHSIIPSVPSIL